MKRLLFILLLVFPYCVFPTYPQQAGDYSFVHIDSEAGLSESNVKAIIQDSYGFMWFGTKNGLNRYDGQHVVRIDCTDRERGHGNQNISSLFEDDKRQLWVGTDEGLFCYDPMKDEFEFLDARTPKGEMIDTWVAAIGKDQKGNLWICAPSQGLFRYDGNILHPHTFPRNITPHNLCICDDGEIYAVAWYTGILKYDPEKRQFQQIARDSRGQSLLGLETNTISQQGDYLVMSLQNGGLRKWNRKRNLLQEVGVQDLTHTFTRFAAAMDDEIYAGTYDGLYVINEKTRSVRHFRQSLSDPSGLSDNIIYSLYRDREGGLWIGTMYGGVSYLPRNTFMFRKYLPRPGHNSFSSRRVRELTCDAKGNLWIGTEDAGLNVLAAGKGKVARYPLPEAGSGTQVTLVVKACGGHVLCSLYKDGLIAIGPDGKSTYHTLKDLGIGSSTSGSSIYALCMDHEGTLWAGSDAGVFHAPKGTLAFTPVPELKDQWVYDIMQARDGTLWFATMGKGVWTYQPKTRKFAHYLYREDDPESVSSNSVTSVMQDSKGHIWLSTDRGGICRYNPGQKNFTRYSIQEGMPDDVAYKILEDDFGYLWFGTNRGLVRFRPETNEIRVFTMKDGLCSNQFNYKSAVKGPDGNFYFGTIDGLVAFNPNIREEATPVPPIYITRFFISGEEMTAHTADSPLEKSIIGTDEIVLPHDRANISFETALLSYSTSQTNEYFYKLEPIDTRWIRTSQGNNISYANLAPGEYVLHIRATADGWKAGDTQYAARALKLIILPPWWASAWAYVAYAICFVAAFSGWFYWYRKHKNRQFAEKQKLFEIEKEKELNQNKVEFFTEIAHEIRTPLTLINGPLEIIREMDLNNNKLTKNLNVIAQNTKRLLNLASQLLDFQKMGAHKLTLNYEVVNVTELLTETVARFEPTYTHQHKELKVEHAENDIIARIDREAITKILSNLLNNALKYGQEHIAVRLDKTDGKNFSVSVASDGEKIPAEKAEQIFEPFFQDPEYQKKRQGVGIGLTLSRSLALLHKGELYLDTQAPVNTFILTIPLNMEDITVPENELLSSEDQPLDEAPAAETSPRAGIILVVEDDEGILAFMKERLSESFIVETATEGKQALDILNREHVDLIISDIMMPGMNGYELCTAVKTDINLSHIPFVFLTAKNDIESKVHGLKAGAEAYVEKPFSYDYLKAQIISLLDNRQKERTAFSKRPFFPVQNMSMSEGDEEFMQQVMKVINEHMKDETFNVEALAEELALSRSSLLRKLKTLFNMSPIDFIRLVRLKKAAELIQDGRYRLNEICYMVGFNSHSYFSKLFCKQFGMTPKDFEKQVAGLREKVRNAQGKDFEALVSPQITPRPAKKAPEDKGKPQAHEEGHPPTA